MDMLKKISNEVDKADAELHEIVDNTILKKKSSNEDDGTEKEVENKEEKQAEPKDIKEEIEDSEIKEAVKQHNILKKCSKCGAELENGALFCPNCGTKQEVIKLCPKCGAALKEGNTFCTECGNKIEDNSAKGMSLNNNRKYITIFAILVLVIVGALGLNTFGSDDKNIVTIKVEDVLNDYIRDQYSAEQKYRNKKINLSGQVYMKGQFKNSDSYFINIGRKYSNGKDYEIILSLEPQDVSVVNKFKDDDFIVAEGTCTGVVPQSNPNIISIQFEHVKVK